MHSYSFHVHFEGNFIRNIHVEAANESTARKLTDDKIKQLYPIHGHRCKITNAKNFASSKVDSQAIIIPLHTGAEIHEAVNQ